MQNTAWSRRLGELPGRSIPHNRRHPDGASSHYRFSPSALGAGGSRLPDAAHDPHHGAVGLVAPGPAEAPARLALPPAGEADHPRSQAVRAASAGRAPPARTPPGATPNRHRAAAAGLKPFRAGPQGEEDRTGASRSWSGYALRREFRRPSRLDEPWRTLEPASPAVRRLFSRSGAISGGEISRIAAHVQDPG